MYENKLTQTLSFLANKDYQLAVRRMLDLARETNNIATMQQAVETCEKLRTYDVETSFGLSTYQHEFKKIVETIEVDLKNKVTIKNELPLLKVEQISKQYSKSNFCLSDVSIEIYAGEIIGVVGENGNGKTTLLNCIAGYLAIDSGLLNYSFLDESDYASIKEHMAFIPQRIPKWYGSLQENLHFSASSAGLKGNENEINVAFMIERMGLVDYKNHSWDELSSGYRTRFEIARILLTKPSMLVLDEPLANLDINAQQTLLADLKFMCDSFTHPLGIILSSQQLFEVEKVADKVILLKQGTQIDIEEKKNTDEKCVVELETSSTKEDIEAALQQHQIKVSFNGNYYMLVSADLELKEIMKALYDHNIDLNYFRDITHSTKRFF